MNTLGERAVLMRFSAGLPGQSRKDKRTTGEVKASKGLGEHAGKWITDLWAEDALASLKTKVNEARDYHNTVTLPFGVKREEAATDDTKTASIAGIGILPAPLIEEYGEKMRIFKSEFQRLVQDFFINPKRYVDWAKNEHNDTFEPKNYPGCSVLSSGEVVLDEAQFKAQMSKKFYLITEPMPVPDYFSPQLHSLLGVDAEAVNIRVHSAEVEAQRELIRRMIEPVKAMADKLSESPKNGKEDIVFRDTLVSNIKDIAALVPKMNLAGDAQLDAFASDMESLTCFTAAELRDDKSVRTAAAQKAAEMVKRLSGYKL